MQVLNSPNHDAQAATEASPQNTATAQDEGFSKLKRRAGSEIFTKFADVKSRISWTPERRELLQAMWDRGDKRPRSPTPWLQGRRHRRRPGALRPEASPHRLRPSEARTG